MPPSPIESAAPPAHPLPFNFGDVLRHWWSFDPVPAGSQWMFVLATVIYNTLFSIALTFAFVAFDVKATLWTTFWQTFLVSQCIGLSIHGMVELVFHQVLRRIATKPSDWQRGALAALAALVGTYIGYSIAFAALGRNFTTLMSMSPRFAFGLLLISLVACVVWVLIMDGQTRRLRAEGQRAHHDAERQRLLALARGAELRALQAQIEPHFLFNTLANVMALIDYEPENAKRMLASFIAHLRQSLDASRQTHATLGSELNLVRSYLELLEIRMGERLRFSLECPDALQSTPFAPLLLQPLVENAVKYGLEPKIEGGCVTIRVHMRDGALAIEVDDNGVGLHARSTASAGAGTGIRNVRERLASLYGAGFALTVTGKDPPLTGTIVTITLPAAQPITL
jgi:two-component sensor histidine kinase